MFKRNTYRKFGTSAMAIAVATSAVAPVVASAETDFFTDVSSENVHYEGIKAMHEKDIIAGFPDGTFKPFESIYRSQVAVLITRTLDLDTPENIEDVLNVYTDVDADSEYAEEIAAVTQAGIFEGNKDDEFDGWTHINREQMATILVKAFELNEVEAEENKAINLENISPSHAENVQVFANLGITDLQEDFRPFEEVNRGQFATFLNRIINLLEDSAESEEPTEEEVEEAFGKVLNGTATVEDFATAGVTGVTSDNLEAVKTAISEIESITEVSAEDIQELVDDLNKEAEQEAAFGKVLNGTATIEDFATAGITGVTSDNLDAVTAAISEIESITSIKVEDVQEIVDELNQEASAAEAFGKVLIGTATVEDFATAGITDVTSDNLEAVKKAISEIESMTNLSAEDIQEIVDEINKDAEIVEAFGKVLNNTATVEDFATAEITGVTTENLEAVKEAILESETSTATTAEDIQKLVDELNKEIEEPTEEEKNKAFGKILNDTAKVKDFVIAGITGVTLDNLDAVKEAISETTFGTSTTTEDIQEIVDELN